MLCCAQPPRPGERRILSGWLEVRDWIRRTSVGGPVDPWGSLNSGVKNRQRKCCWEEERILHKCRSLSVGFPLGARPLLSWAADRTFRHGHLQPPQPLARARGLCASLPWWTLAWRHRASVDAAPRSSARVLAGAHAVCSPRSGLFCQSPASAPVLCLLPAPRLSPLCSRFS